ncbi:MAG: tail-specific protease [Bacteroidetes bacterium]|nr:MAG: tail-specific protease [Bacteroidota bacterium]
MKFKSPILFALIAGVLTFFAFYPPYNQAEKEAVLMQSILTGLSYYHYQPQEINDAFSEKVFDLYLERMDGAKRWLTQKEVNELQTFRHKLDDEALQGTYEFMNLAIQFQEAGIDKTQAYYREFLSHPFDFSKDESIELDGEKRTFAKDDAELKELWRKQMKYETLTRLVDKINKKEEGHEDYKDMSMEDMEAEARKETLKVYDDWYARLHKRKRHDHLSNYLNAFTNVFDPHTGYFEPIDRENFNIGMSGKLKGIGARLMSDGDYTKVSEVIVGGPAWKAGELEKDDRILKVAQSADETPVDLTGMPLDEVVQLIRGEPGTTVYLWIKKADGTVEEISIVRDVVIIEESFAKSLILETEDVGNIGYINLPRFYGDYENPDGRQCSDDIRKEIEKLKGENVKGIILDLRNNGGGYLSEVVKMSGLFVEQGPVVQVKNRGRRPQVLKDEDPRVQYDGPVIVLVNQFSASASEILTAALQDYGRAIIVGTAKSTHGKGTVQRFWNLDNGIPGHNDLKPLGSIKLTIQNYYRINGGSVQLKGVQPDIVIPSNNFYLETGEKENKYPLQYSEIEPAQYEQHVYEVASELPKVKEASVYRVRNNPVFQKIDEIAKRRKQEIDHSEMPLKLDVFQAEEAELEAMSEEYKALMEKEVLPNVRNLKVDAEALANADEGKIARNEEWLKNVKKDVYLEETLHIMKDMIKY